MSRGVRMTTARRIAAVLFAASIASVGLVTQSALGVTAALTCNGLAATITAADSGTGNFEGTPGDDVIVGTDGPDVIYGYGGNDTICSRKGNDEVHGGKGNDYIALGNGNDVGYGAAGNDTMM